MAIAIAVTMESSNRCLSKSYVSKKKMFSKNHLRRTVTKNLKQVLSIPKNEFSSKKLNSSKICKNCILQNFVSNNNLIDNYSTFCNKNLKKIHNKEKTYIFDLKYINSNFKKNFSNNIGNVIKSCQSKKKTFIQSDLMPSTSTNSVKLCMINSNKESDKTKNQRSTFDLTSSNNKKPNLFFCDNNLSYLQNTLPILPSIDNES